MNGITSYKYIVINMLIFSIFFSYGLNKTLSPVLFAFCIFTLVYLRDLIYKVKINRFQFLILFFVFIILIILIFQKEYMYHRNGLLNEVFRNIFWLLYGFIFAGLVSNIRKISDWSYVINKSIPFILFIFFVESLYRIYSGLGSGFNFYNFKFNSLLYPDSNFVAINLLILYIFVDKFCSYISGYKIHKILLIFLILLCFSRTVYLIFIFYIFSKNFNFLGKKSYKKWIFIVSSIFVTILGVFLIFNDLYSYIITDGSFLTKLEIFENFTKYFFSDGLTFLFGVGSGNLIDFTGRESHNLFGLTIEMGVVWIVLIIILFTNFLREKNFSWIVMAVLFSGFSSLFPMTYLTLFICLFILVARFNKLSM